MAIKAQHPLTPEGNPGAEYEARLERALRVKNELEAEGLQVVFMTTGGIHQGCDTTTLAEAGKNWLVSHGVPAESVVTRPVVYSGNDEDLQAAELMRSDENFKELHVVMSVGQCFRTILLYDLLGWQPTLHPITFLEEKPHHSAVCEMWGPWGAHDAFRNVNQIGEETNKIRCRHIEEANR
ncbi:YdcF family protein [Candidatus Saccharibacteria bacterium]|nr:YdcF family protein [Candidatus Saccharibacteria bacterium]